MRQENIKRSWQTANPSAYHIHIYGRYEQTDYVMRSIAGALTPYISPDADEAGYSIGVVGPHTQKNVQFTIKPESFLDVFLWLEANRRSDMSVLIHPVTGDDLEDHTKGAIWLGTPVELKESVFSSNKQLKQAP